MTHPDTQHMQVSLDDLPPLLQLGASWQTLEERTEPSFFQSWLWIGTWLESLPDRIAPQLIKVERDGQIAGLGILCRRTVVRHGLLRSRALFLNDTGDPELDEITIEHNGLLLEQSSTAGAAQAIADFLCSHVTDWDELFLDGLRQPGLFEPVNLGVARLKTVNRRACYYVDLDNLRQAGGDYLSGLGKNTRYAIRRSMRAYEKLGALQLDQATSIPQAHEFMDRLRFLHQQYWQQKGLPGSFANSFFSDFHLRLVEKGLDRGAIQLLRVTAGGREIGYLYNFVHRGRIYNYQSGFDYELVGAHGRPGLVCHVLAVEHNARLGHTLYDFMAGDSDYKKNLGTHSEVMSWQVLQQPRMKFRVENMLRAIKQRFRRNPQAAVKVTPVDSSSVEHEGRA